MQLSPSKKGALAHPHEAVVALVSQGSGVLRHLETNTVVGDGQVDGLGLETQRQPDVLCLGMAPCVVKRFLGDAVQAQFAGRRKPA